eukprot:g11995.t1
MNRESSAFSASSTPLAAAHKHMSSAHNLSDGLGPAALSQILAHQSDQSLFGGAGPMGSSRTAQGAAAAAGAGSTAGMRHGNFYSRRRQNHAVYDHKKDSFIEWIKSILMSTFDLDIMDKQIPVLLGHVDELAKEHMEMSKEENITGGPMRASRLSRIVPDVPVFFTPLKLREAFLIYNKKYRITSRRFVYPTFNEIRHVLNLAQVLGLPRLKLMTFDGDQTLYPDQKNLEDLFLAQQLLQLLKANVAIALVTAANYGLDGSKYETRLRVLLEYFKAKRVPTEFVTNFFIVAGESSGRFILRIGPDYRIHPAQDVWPYRARVANLTDNMKFLLDECEKTMRGGIDNMNMKAQILRKQTSVGCIQSYQAKKPGQENYYFRREQLDELVFRLQETLIVNKEKIDFPYCAFNGGNDVWFDIGNKREGIAGLQELLNVHSEECLHVGDQMARTGNDFMARFISPVCWIVNPSETKKILKHVLRKLGYPSSTAHAGGGDHNSKSGAFGFGREMSMSVTDSPVHGGLDAISPGGGTRSSRVRIASGSSGLGNGGSANRDPTKITSKGSVSGASSPELQPAAVEGGGQPGPGPANPVTIVNQRSVSGQTVGSSSGSSSKSPASSTYFPSRPSSRTNAQRKMSLPAYITGEEAPAAERTSSVTSEYRSTVSRLLDSTATEAEIRQSAEELAKWSPSQDSSPASSTPASTPRGTPRGEGAGDLVEREVAGAGDTIMFQFSGVDGDTEGASSGKAANQKPVLPAMVVEEFDLAGFAKETGPLEDGLSTMATEWQKRERMLREKSASSKET